MHYFRCHEAYRDHELVVMLSVGRHGTTNVRTASGLENSIPKTMSFDDALRFLIFLEEVFGTFPRGTRGGFGPLKQDWYSRPPLVNIDSVLNTLKELPCH